jgi:hypothetical protein
MPQKRYGLKLERNVSVASCINLSLLQRYTGGQCRSRAHCSSPAKPSKLYQSRLEPIQIQVISAKDV